MMNSQLQRIRRWVAHLVWLVTSLMAAQGLQAATFGDTCAVCHANSSTEPPYLLSQNATYGKIISLVNDGRFDDSCLSATPLFNCGLRRKLLGIDSSGTIVNATARANMLGYAATVSNSDLEAIRLYLIKVRDAEISTPAPTFTPTVIDSSTTATFSFTISNYRGVPINYSLSLTGTHAGDYAILSAATGVVPATTTSAASVSTITVTIRFQPTGVPAGTRSAQLRVNLSPANAADPQPLDKNIALSAQALLQLQLSATTLNPSAIVGTPSTSSMLLTNRGPTALTLNTLSFSGTHLGDYSLDAINGCTVGLSLPASGGCTLVIRFDPGADGARNATLNIAHSASGSPQSVTLLGTATLQGAIALSALSYSFGDTWLGNPNIQSITVQNPGSLALTFSAFNLSGHTGDFARSGTCSTATPLAIGAQCTVILTFTPTTLGPRSASLTILSDASNGSATLSITGTGVPVPAPIVTLSTAALDFGPQTVGGLYPARRITLTNSGNADLSIASLTVAGSTFADASTTPCPATLAAGASCDTLIAFSAPAASASPYTGTLTIIDNAAGSPHSVALTGSGTATAVPVLVWSPDVSHVDFSGTPVLAGNVSAPQRVTLLNSGPGGVTLSVLNAVGVDAAAFSVSAVNCAIGAPLYEGESCDFDVLFAPASAGTKHASIQIASTVNTFPPTVTLSGIGLGGPSPGMALSTSAITFDTTRVGAHSLPTEIRLSSNGSGVIRVTALQVTGPYEMQHKTCPALPFTLPAGSDCTLTVAFVPQTEGGSAGSLRVTTDASGAPQEIALSGHADPAPDVTTGGCSTGTGTSPADPTLWALALLAAAALLWRWQTRALAKKTNILRRN